ERTHPVDRQQTQHEEDPLAQVRDVEDVLQRLDHRATTSQVPPAAVILSRAPWVKCCATTCSGRSISPPPRILRPSRPSRRTIPASSSSAAPTRVPASSRGRRPRAPTLTSL